MNAYGQRSPRVKKKDRGFFHFLVDSSVDDVRIHTALPTVQAMLGLPNQLNEIRVLEFYCDADAVDPKNYLRSALEPLLPGTGLIRRNRLAETRRHQPLLVARDARVTNPMIVMRAVFA